MRETASPKVKQKMPCGEEKNTTACAAFDSFGYCPVYKEYPSNCVFTKTTEEKK